MTHALEMVAWLAGIIVPFALAAWTVFGHGTDDVLISDDPHAADAAFEAEKLADARLQPFNGGAR